MPNGDDKNLVRFCAAVDGFHSRYGKWPMRVVMGEGYRVDLVHILGPEAFQRVASRLALVVKEGATFRAEGETGEAYDYGLEGFTDRPPKVNARQWLELGD